MGADEVRRRDSGAILLEIMQPGTVLYPAFAELAPKGKRFGLATGILLSRAYWIAQKRGEEWEFSAQDWTTGTALSADQVTDGLKRLEEAGILTRYRVGVVKRMRYRLDLDKLAHLLTKSVPVTGKSGYGKPENPVTGNRKIRSRVYNDSPVSNETGGGRKTSRTALPCNPPPPSDLIQEQQAPVIGATWEAWEVYGRSLSPAWVDSGDCRDCWDDMVSVEWRDAGRRIVRDWEAKARRYLRTWRKDGGEAKERARSVQDRNAASQAAAAQERTEEGRKRMAEAQAAAAAGDWDLLRSLEARWMAADPAQFDFYRREKRPAEWARELSERARRRSKAA